MGLRVLLTTAHARDVSVGPQGGMAALAGLRGASLCHITQPAPPPHLALAVVMSTLLRFELSVNPPT